MDRVMTSMNRLMQYLLVFLLMLGLWVLLTASLQSDSLLRGMIVAAIVTLLSSRLLLLNSFKLAWSSLPAMARYLGRLFPTLLSSTLDMAGRTLTPALPLRPSVVEIRTCLQSDLGKFLLANSISLSPGMLCIDVRDNRMLVHSIHSRDDYVTEIEIQKIAIAFEQELMGFVR